MRSSKIAVAAVARRVILGVALVLSSGAAIADAPPHTQWTDDGPILVTAAGMTLYIYGVDATSPGKSTCADEPKKTYGDEQGGMGPAPLIGADIHKSCSEKWPPYLADERARPIGDFSLIDRPNGSKQWSFRGSPLYLSIRDHKPGDRLGMGHEFFGSARGGFHFATTDANLPADLKLAHRDQGLVLLAPNGKPVYTPRLPRIAKACVDCDADPYEPVLAPELLRVSGEWSTVDAGVGRRQFAFQGKPLYAAPNDLKEYEISATDGWEMVVYRKTKSPPTEILKHLTLIGDVYTDGAGHTLYTFNCVSPARDGVRCDDPGDPAGYWVALCGDAKECAKRWHPYIASPRSRSAGDWSVVEVAYPMFTTNPGVTYPPDAPRVKAWAYRGYPVYTYYEDKEPGDIWGDNIKWIGGSNFAALRVPGREMTN